MVRSYLWHVLTPITGLTVLILLTAVMLLRMAQLYFLSKLVASVVASKLEVASR
jgi:hypothetical protein